MNKITTIVLCFLTISVFSQTLKYPKKNCEGASARPDDLHSWCQDSVDEYYDECECNFEKAIKRYNKAVKRIDEQRDQLSEKIATINSIIDSHTVNARQISDKIYDEVSENFESDKTEAISYYQKAIEEYKNIIAIRDDICALNRLINPNNYCDKNTSIISTIKGYESSIESLRNLQETKKVTINIGSPNHNNSQDEYENSSMQNTTNESSYQEKDFNSQKTQEQEELKRRLAKIEAETARIEKQNARTAQASVEISNELVNIFSGELKPENIMNITQSLLNSGLIKSFDAITAVGIGGGVLAAGVGIFGQAKKDRIKRNAYTVKTGLNNYQEEYINFQKAVDDNDKETLLAIHIKILKIEDEIIESLEYLIDKTSKEGMYDLKKRLLKTQEQRIVGIGKLDDDVKKGFSKTSRKKSASFFTTFNNPIFEPPLYSSPHPNSSLVYKSPKTSVVEVLNTSNDPYYEVIVDGYKGYVSKNFLSKERIQGNAVIGGVFETTFNNPIFEPTLYEKPHPNSKTIYKCPKDATVKVIDNSGKTYYKVIVNGYSGYVSKHFLTHKKRNSQKVTEKSFIKQSTFLFETTFDNPIFEPNLYSEARPNSDIVYKCPKDAKVKVMHKSNEIYFKVSVNNNIGYVSKHFLKRKN